jgi:acetyltransferase-like isoleucine patch superfamily enzyme
MTILNRFLKFYHLRFSSPERYLTFLGGSVGDKCKIATKYFGSEPYLITIGNRVQITRGVKFFCHGGSWVLRKEYPKFDFFGKIEIGNNVYIGNDTLLLPGIKIGDNVLIGAGSVVTKSIECNSVVGGNPARRICSIEDFYEKYRSFNIDTYGISEEEKRKIIKTLNMSKFVVK